MMAQKLMCGAAGLSSTLWLWWVQSRIKLVNCCAGAKCVFFLVTWWLGKNTSANFHVKLGLVVLKCLSLLTLIMMIIYIDAIISCLFVVAGMLAFRWWQLKTFVREGIEFQHTSVRACLYGENHPTFQPVSWEVRSHPPMDSFVICVLRLYGKPASPVRWDPTAREVGSHWGGMKISI